MKPEQVIEAICRSVTGNLNAPTLLLGPPGIGKTSLIRAAAKKLGFEVITTILSIHNPSDSRGLGSMVNGEAVFSPYDQIKRLMNAKVPTFWFMDDFGQATKAQQMAYMPWLLDRELEGKKLSDYVHIIAASNDRTHKAGVDVVLEPVKSRFKKILTVEPDYSYWRREFAIPNKIAPEIISYLDFCEETGNTDAFFNFKPTSDFKCSPSPRTWTAASSNIQSAPDVELTDTTSILFDEIVSNIGESEATKFYQFLKLRHEISPMFYKIIAGQPIAIPPKLDLVYALIAFLVPAANSVNFANIYSFALKLKDMFPDTTVLLLKDCVSRHPDLCNTPTFMRMVTKEFAIAFSDSDAMKRAA